MKAPTTPTQKHFKQALVSEKKMGFISLSAGLTIGLLAALLTLAIAIDKLNYKHFLYEERKSLLNEAATLRAKLEGTISSNLQTVQGLTAIINASPTLTQETFALYAKPLINDSTQLRNLGAAPDLVLQYIYPLEGNEGAIGLDYRSTLNQLEAVERAEKSGQLVVAGPVNLKQGGQGFIGRIPILTEQNGQRTLWGILSAVVDVERFYEASGVHSFQDNHDLAIRGKDGLGVDGDVFLGNPSLFSSDALITSITLPSGSWQMAVKPKNGWPQRADNAFLLRSILTIVVLLLLLPAPLITRLLQHRKEKDLRLRGLFELSPVGISLNRHGDGRYLETNAALEKMLGYTAEELQHKTYYDLTPSEYAEHQRALLDSLNRTGRYGPYEKEFICKDGSRLPVLMNGMLVTSAKGEPLIWSIVENISSRKQAEYALAQNKRQLEQIIDNTAVGIWDWTIPTGEATFNERWADIIGYTLDELEPTSIDTWMAYAHPEDLQKSSDLLQAHWEGKTENYQMEARMRHKNGEWIWVYDSGRVIEWTETGEPLRMVGTHLDITTQKNAQKLIEASQIELNNFFDHSPNFMCITSASGYFDRVNNTFCKVLGYSKEELLANPYTNLIHPDDIQPTIDEAKKIAKGINTLSFTNRYKTKSGEYRYLQWNATPNLETGKFYATAVDITQKKADEEKLARQQEMLVSMSQQGRIGAWETHLEDGEIYWSEMTKDIYEVPQHFHPDARTALSFFKIDNTLEQIQELMRQAIINGIPGKIELPIITAKGNERWVSITGHPERVGNRCTRLFGSIQDIDERKRQEHAIQVAHTEMEKQMSMVNAIAKAQASFIQQTDIVLAFDNLLEGLLNITHSEYGFISEVLETPDKQPFIKNHAIGNQSKHSRYNEFFSQQGANPIEFFNMENLLGSAITSNAVVISNTPSSDPRSGGIPDGHPRLGSYLGIPIKQNNKIIGLVGLANNPDGYDEELVNWLTPLVHTVGQMIESVRGIREREHVQKELIKAKNAAELAVQTKSEFLAMMSHEIRTPLNGVLGMLNLVLRTGLEDKQRYQIGIAKSSAESLMNLINDILDFSKVDAGKLDLEIVEFNFVTLLEDIGHAMAARAAERNNEIIIDITQLTESIFRGDPSRLRQILLNLIGNAIKFTEHGEVIITCNISPTMNGIKLCVSVKDTGIGIPEEKISQLFTAFTQVDASTTRKFGGTGLGLAICKKLCVLMGGDIHVIAKPDIGSTFSFHVLLQTASTSNKLGSKGLQPPSDTTLAGKSFYIADKVENNIAILKHIIERKGGRVLSPATVFKPQELIESGSMVDFAIIDTRLLSSPSDINILKQSPNFYSCKYILATSVNRTADTEKHEEWGFHGYLTRPLTASSLLIALQPLMVSSVSTQEKNLELSGHNETTETSESSLPPSPQPKTAVAHRVLLVEDNTVNQEVATMMLEDFGLIIDIANNGLEALEALDASAETTPYSLIFMDCQMPEMDGYEATKRIRQGRTSFDNTKIPIIAMTANAMKGDKEKCLAAGMDDYLSKPIETDDLEAMLKLWLPLHDFSNTSTATEATSSELSNARVWARSELLATLKGREDRLKILVKSFSSRIPLVLTDLTKAEQNEDLEALSFIAHSVKGSAGQLKANPLFVCASELEQTAKAQQLPTSLAMCKTFRKLISELYSLLCKELEQSEEPK